MSFEQNKRWPARLRLAALVFGKGVGRAGEQEAGFFLGEVGRLADGLGEFFHFKTVEIANFDERFFHRIADPTRMASPSFSG